VQAPSTEVGDLVSSVDDSELLRQLVLPSSDVGWGTLVSALHVAKNKGWELVNSDGVSSRVESPDLLDVRLVVSSHVGVDSHVATQS